MKLIGLAVLVLVLLVPVNIIYVYAYANSVDILSGTDEEKVDYCWDNFHNKPTKLPMSQAIDLLYIDWLLHIHRIITIGIPLIWALTTCKESFSFCHY